MPAGPSLFVMLFQYHPPLSDHLYSDRHRGLHRDRIIFRTAIHRHQDVFYDLAASQNRSCNLS